MRVSHATEFFWPQNHGVFSHLPSTLLTNAGAAANASSAATALERDTFWWSYFQYLSARAGSRNDGSDGTFSGVSADGASDGVTDDTLARASIDNDEDIDDAAAAEVLVDEGSVDGVDGTLRGVAMDEDGGDGVGTRTVAERRCWWIEDVECDGKDADREAVDDDPVEAIVDEDIVDVLEEGTLVAVGSWERLRRRLCWVEAAEDDELADSTLSHIKQCGRFRCRWRVLEEDMARLDEISFSLRPSESRRNLLLRAHY